MMDFSNQIATMIQKAGKPVTLVRSDNSEESFFAVIEQTWKKHQTRVEEKAGPIGRYRHEYYYYVGPSTVDLCALDEDDTLYVDGDAYQMQRAERVLTGNTVQFYRGILKKIKGGDGDVYGQ